MTWRKFGTFCSKMQFSKIELYHKREVSDLRVVRAGISTSLWHEIKVLSWSGGHNFKPWSGRTSDAYYFCTKSHLNQNYISIKYIYIYIPCPRGGCPCLSLCKCWHSIALVGIQFPNLIFHAGENVLSGFFLSFI